MKINRWILSLAAVLLSAALLTTRAKADDLDFYRNKETNCPTSAEEYKKRADGWKDYLQKKTIPGLTESAGNKATYKDALDRYNKYKKNSGYEERMPGISLDRIDDKCGASDGFMNYDRQMDIDNEEAYRKWQASKETLTDDQKAIKTQLESCVASLKQAQDTNNKLNEASKNISHTKNPQLTTVGKVNGNISAWVKNYSVIYTAANLKDCQTLAADTTVGDEYAKLSGNAFGQAQRDAAARKAEQDKIDAQKAAEKKAYDDAHTPQAIAAAKAKKKAEDDAEDAKRAAARVAELKAIQDNNIKGAKDASTRMGAIGTRVEAGMKSGAVGDADVATMVSYQKQINGPLGDIIVGKTNDVSYQSITPIIDQYEKWIAGLEAKNAARLAAEQKAQEERNAKAEVERKRWLAAHPTDISGACHSACMIRHDGAGPHETECERECQVTENAVKQVVDLAFDQALKGVGAVLDKVGVSKALCEAANSKVGDLLSKANAQVDKLSEKVKEKSEEACKAAGGSVAKCKYVAKFVTTAQAAKECSNVAKSLKGSSDKAAADIAAKKKVIADNKDKASKGDKDAQKLINDAAKDTIKETEPCESPKASEMIANIVKPCTEAAEGGLWLSEHAGDYSGGGSEVGKTAAIISVVEATYGATTKPVGVPKCPDAKSGNATAKLKEACAGKSSCNFKVSAGDLGDPAPGCFKGFAATFKCDGGADKKVDIKAADGEASGQTVTLSCGG